MDPRLEPLEKALKALDHRSAVLGEVLATLSIEHNHSHIPDLLRDLVDRWRVSVGLKEVNWK